MQNVTDIDWGKLFVSATISPTEDNYIREIYEDEEYRLVYFTTENPYVETAVVFYNREVFAIGINYQIIINWQIIDINHDDWNNINEFMFEHFDNGVITADSIKTYIGAIISAAGSRQFFTE